MAKRRKMGAPDEWLKSILSRIADGSLLPASYYRRLDCDAVLDTRDGDAAFVAEWMRQNEEVDRRWADADLSTKARALAEDIRRESFLAVSRATEQHEIASYVSDDFDLIFRGRLIGMPAGLLDQLWSVYETGEFPRPPL